MNNIKFTTKTVPLDEVLCNGDLFIRLKQLTLQKRELTNGGSSLLSNRLSTFKSWQIVYQKEIEKSKAIVISNLNNIIGWGLLLFEKDEYLIGVYIDEDFRKIGLGTEIVKTAISHCKDNGLMLTSKSWNKPSYNFYNKLGFKNAKSTNPNNIRKMIYSGINK